MENYLWLVYALLSAVAAAMVSVFGKIGLQGLDAHTATAVRAVIMAAFLAATAAVVFLHETVSAMSAAGIGLITAGIILVALG